MLDLNELPSEGIEDEEASEIYSTSTNQPDSEYILDPLSAQKKLSASNSLSVYYEPVEIYNKIRSRPRFLQRNLYHNRKAKHKKRILMTVLLSWKIDEIKSIFPLCIGLGSLDPNKEPTGEEKYHVSRILTFEGPSGIGWDGINHVRVKFMLPHIEKLAVETDYDKYFLFFVGSAENPISLSTVNTSTLMPSEVASNESSGGENCVYGKVSLKFLYEILNISPDSPLQYRTEIQFSTEIRSCNLKYWLKHYARTKSSTISIRDTNDSEVEGISKKLEISTGFEEFGAANEEPLCMTQERPEEASSSSLLPHITKLPGIVSFHYRYYHNMLDKLEVTENFTCAVCLVQCISYKSLKFHLTKSHTIFNLEFSESEGFPSVSISVKPNWKQQLIDPKLDTFMYRGKSRNRRKLSSSSHGRNNTEELVLDFELRIGVGDARLLENIVDGAPPVLDSDNGTNAMQQIEPEEASNKAIVLVESPVPDQNNQTLTTLEVEQEQVSNAVSNPSECCVPTVSDHDDGTRGVQEVEFQHEEISNAIVLYTGQGSVPAISEHDDEARAVLEDDVSNATILPTNEDCVPAISEHDNGALAKITENDNGARAVLHDDVLNATILHENDSEARAVVHEDEVTNAIILHPGLDFVPSVPMDEGTSSVPPAEDREEVLSELFDPNTIARWKKRKFYHSHTYQAMDLHEVVRDEDSEDEINEGARVVEEKRKLEQLGLSEDQKRLVTMWGSFVKKQRVLADGHMNWAYEAFTKLHCAELADSPALAWSWRLFMIKLYDHGLLTSKTVGACFVILQQYQKQKSDPKKSDPKAKHD